MAVEKTHQKLFHLGKCPHSGINDRINSDTLKDALVEQRKVFTPAIENPQISDALYKIKKDRFFARPVRGADKSRFAVNAGEIFDFADRTDAEREQETKELHAGEVLELLRTLLDSEVDKSYKYISLV